MDWAQRKAALVADSIGRTAERSYVYGANVAESVGNPLENYREEWDEAAARVDEFTGHAILSAQQLSRVRALPSWNQDVHHAVAKLRVAGEKTIHKNLLYTIFQGAVRRIPEYAEDCRETVVVTKWEATGRSLVLCSRTIYPIGLF